MQVVRSQGKIMALEEKLRSEKLKGTVGIGHTRWATHGRPSDRNAHPHHSGPLAVVHNGIIENYAVFKKNLEQEGFEFSSETDTEVMVKLAERAMRSGLDFLNSVVTTLRELRGSYALVFLCEKNPEELIAARKESPLILGLSDDAVYVASDVPAILPYTRKVVFLEDDEIACISRSGVRVQTFEGDERKLQPQWIDWNPVMAEKAGYKHFMLKEIHEQPRAVIDTFRSEIVLDRQDVLFPDMQLSKSRFQIWRRSSWLPAGRLTMPAWLASTCSKDYVAYRLKWISVPSFGIGSQYWETRRSWWSSANQAKLPIPGLRCLKAWTMVPPVAQLSMSWVVVWREWLRE